MADEIVDIVDEHGKVLRQASKHAAHEHGWLHKTVIGVIRRDNEWAFVRQASDRQDAHQLVYPVGGHVKAGETDIDALFREAAEEVNIRNIQHSHVGTHRFHRQIRGRDENHLFIVYEIQTEDEIILGEEAVAIEWLASDKLRKMLHQVPGDFGDGFYFVTEHFYPDHLPKTYSKRWKI